VHASLLTVAGSNLFWGNMSPTVPGVLESQDRKQALLLGMCPHLLLQVQISFRAMYPQQYRELSNPKIKNKQCCCARVLADRHRFESLSGQHIPNSTGSSQIRRSKTSVAVVYVSSLGFLSSGQIGCEKSGAGPGLPD
jgi:hypothetical protein